MSGLDLVVRGGTVVTASDSYAADVGIRDGHIIAILSLGGGKKNCEKLW